MFGRGHSLWTKQHTTYYGGTAEYPAHSYGNNIIQTTDGGYLAIGQTFPDLWALKVDENGDLTGIGNDNELLTDGYELFQNYPNPFNNETVIAYSINSNSEVELNMFNIKGEFINRLVNEKKSAGRYSVIFKSDNLNSGIYYYQLKINGVIKDSRRMLYLK